MSAFSMCPSCRKEYITVSDRRFHAEPVACNHCGPSYYALYNKVEVTDYSELLNLSSRLLREGEVIAAKGIGGYHLICDARSEKAVSRLREIKQRDGKPFAENIEITKRVVEYAHDHGVVVEAELGTLAGIEDEVKVAAHEASYTRPEEVEEFVSKTGCDSLAIAIGTSHGAYKFKPEQCTRNEQGILVPPPLRFDVLKEVSRRLPGFPNVLHGSSSVPQEYVKMSNDHGGRMPNAIGVPEEQLREAAKLSVCKINIDSDLRLAMTGTIRQFMEEHPDKFDPREYLKPARANI